MMSLSLIDNNFFTFFQFMRESSERVDQKYIFREEILDEIMGSPVVQEQLEVVDQ